MTYTTEDGATVTQGDAVYDYYSMEPIEIGRDLGDGWFATLKPGTQVRGSAGMLDGSRICTLAYAKRRGFRGHRSMPRKQNVKVRATSSYDRQAEKNRRRARLAARKAHARVTVKSTDTREA